MIRVLQCVNNMHRAGLETVLMNYYRNMDRTQIQFDFLTHRPDRDDYDDEIEALGGRIYRAPRLYPQNYPAYFAYMKQLFSEHPEYQIVHSHIDSMSYLPLLAAKKAGVPVRISHSHNTGIDKDMKYILKQYFRYRLPSVATHYWSCGEQAGQFLFRGAPFTVVANAIDTERFRYDPQIRAKKRAELGLGDRFTVAHAGRFSYQKNHEFLLDIFCRVLDAKPDAVLMLVGKGEKEQQIREKIHSLGIQNSVLLLGSRSDLNELYQAMDVFVLPSRFEGVPMVGIEAQYSGLPCVFSDKVPPEVAFTDDCCFVPLESTAQHWADQVLRLTGERTAVDGGQWYDIRCAHRRLTAQYQSLYAQIHT